MGVSCRQISYYEDNMERTTDHVTMWLKRLRPEGSDQDIINQGCQLDDGRDRAQPTTPPRCSSTLQIPVDSSPITSIFSNHSLFDSPLCKDIQLTAPTREPNDDESTDYTSIDGEEDDEGIAKKTSIASKYQQPFYIPSTSPKPPAPPSSIQLDFDHSVVPSAQSSSTAHSLSYPRVVNITSCLQCTLANLPCSRTTPSCTRCVRNGHGATCLLTRRLFPEETAQSDSRNPSSLVLLKLKGANEDVWRRKMELKDTLLEQWQVEKDQENWVFPSLGGRLKSERKKWGWEGMGRVMYETLCVHVNPSG